MENDKIDDDQGSGSSEFGQVQGELPMEDTNESTNPGSSEEKKVTVDEIIDEIAQAGDTILGELRHQVGSIRDMLAQATSSVVQTTVSVADHMTSDIIDQRLTEVQQRILEMGRQEKERITEQGKVTAEKMVVGARAYSKYRMNLAKKALSDEMVDIAISIAEERLREAISEEDNENLNNLFIKHLETSKQGLG